MVSDEWWIYHLTPNGWVAGSYKEDFQKEKIVNPPSDAILSRRYWERLPHQLATMKRGFDHLSGDLDAANPYLEKYPHPEHFKKDF